MCRQELKISMAVMGDIYKLLDPVEDAIARFQAALQAYVTRADTYERPIMYACVVMSQYLRKMDGSNDIAQLIVSTDMSLVRTYQDYLALADLWSKSSLGISKPFCECVLSGMKTLDHYGTLGLSATEAIGQCQPMLDIFSSISDATTLIKQTRCAAFDLHLRLGYGIFSPSPFENPVYDLLVHELLPTFRKVLNETTDRGRTAASLHTISSGLESILSYEALIVGSVDSSARIFLMELPDFLQSIPDLSTLPPKFKTLFTLFLSASSALVNATEFYEHALKPVRCLLFQRLGSQAPSYNDFRALRSVFFHLGRLHGFKEDGVLSASRVVKENKFLLKIYPSLAHLSEMRSSDQDRNADSLYTVTTLWNTFVIWLNRLESPEILIETAVASTSSNGSTAPLAPIATDCNTSCWPYSTYA